jgi:hypothetical protein
MAAEQVTEQVVEQVADHLEEVADATRRINPTAVKYFLGGVGVGVVIGLFVGYRYNREKIKAEAFKESEIEIAAIRESYQQKMVALENEAEKKEMVGIVVEKGYSADDTQVVLDLEGLKGDPARESYHQPTRPLRPPVPVDPPKKVFRHVDNTKDKMEGWNFPREMSSRTANKPHIIHQDEFGENETEYDQVTYTYYAEDDVLLDEKDGVLTNREILVPPDFARRFGHGSDDFNILYIRNPVLELEIEICRSPGSYEVQVLGLERESGDEPS